ncbi:hypothetical protein ACV3VG_09660 [Clostridium perfringens]|uniref:hypothetical protein n=1 Tax=Clostridium perfringens TaxID=1502 RepID=UPI003AF8D78D
MSFNNKKYNLEELDSLILKTLLAGENMLYLDMSEFLDYAIKNTIFFDEKISYFENFDEIIFKVIKEYIKDSKFKTGKDEFFKIFGICANSSNKFNSNSNKLFSFEDDLLIDLKYYHVYYNGYVRTTFNILFNGKNDQLIEKYRNFDIEDVISRFKYYLELFSINKLRYSYNNYNFGDFDEKKEKELDYIKKLMIEAHCNRIIF